MSDTEVVEHGDVFDPTPPDDMGSIVYDGMSSIPFFTVFIAIVMYILLDSTIYNNNVLRCLNKDFIDDIGNKRPSGIVVTGILFGILLGLFEAMHSAQWI